MFAGIWAKITALLTAIIGGLLLVLKLKSDKVDRLEEKVQVNDKLDEIRKEQKEAIQEVLKYEAKTIEEKTKCIPQVNMTEGKEDRPLKVLCNSSRYPSLSG